MKAKLSIIILLSVIYGGCLIAAPINVSGKVTNNGVSVRNTQVYIEVFGADTTFFTDSIGFYNVIVKSAVSQGTMKVFFLDCNSDSVTILHPFINLTTTIRANLNGCQGILATGSILNFSKARSTIVVYFYDNNFSTFIDSTLVDTNGGYKKKLPLRNTGTLLSRIFNCNGLWYSDSVWYKVGDTIKPILNYCRPEPNYNGTVSLNSRPISGSQGILLRYIYIPSKQKFEFQDTISITPSGKFNFPNDGVSDYLLKVIPTKDTFGFAATYYPNGITWDAKNTKGVGPHLTSSLTIDLKSYNIPRGIYSIEGRVKLDASLKKPGYSAIGIHLLDLNNNQVEFIYSDESSDFKFHNIDSGDYKIWIDQCGVPTEPKLISLRGGANQITGITLTANDNGISYDRFVGFTELKNEPEISIYPNPFYYALNLEVPSNSTISIHDLMGQSIFEKSTISSGFQQLETDSWQSGIYIITIETQGQLYQRKLIKR